MTRRINYDELLNGQMMKMSVFPNLHTDWVRKVQYIANLDSFVSCANTSKARHIILLNLIMETLKNQFKERFLTGKWEE